MSWQRRLFQDKSLLQVFKRSWSIPTKPINYLIPLLVLFIILLVAYSENISGYKLISRSQIIENIRLIGSSGVNFTSAILGFLIAGFSIFASITKPEIFVVLAQIEHKESGLTRLQFIFYNFILIFIHYVTFLAVCFVVVFGFGDGGVFAGVVKIVIASGLPIVDVAGGTVLSILMAWLSYMLILLKAFIWNLYQSVLLALAAEAELRHRGIDPFSDKNGRD